LQLLDQELLKFYQAVMRRESPRLAIFMPPRHGKSERVSKHFPAWALIQNPDLKVILASYSDDKAREWGRKAQALFVEHGGRYSGLSLNPAARAADEWEIADHTGGMKTAGVGGALTGFGAEICIIDDPVKDAKQANSETYRESAWEWYTGTFYSRIHPGGGVLLMNTRWHEDDLSGRILKNAKQTGEQWRILSLPALSAGPTVDPLGRPEGAALWPERYDEVALNRIKGVAGTYWFSAQYQQSPMPNEGGRFKRSWIRHWSLEGDLFVLQCD
jgi:hypothetical protein